MEAFDVAWTRFEEAYIGQLMEIEKSARGLLVEAIAEERCLSNLEQECRRGQDERSCPTEECDKQKLRLFACLSCLNSVANVNRKGREDLGPEVFEASSAALRRGEAASGSPTGVIITEVADSYEAMRNYLRQVEPFLDQVAPRLSENVGLAARLAQLEEGWELGLTYLLHEPMHVSMNSLVKELKTIVRIVPQLRELCDSCDVEWLLVLPKLVWLCFLEHPDRHLEVLKSLLPHRFPEGSALGGDVRYRDAELQRLRVRFHQVHMVLAFQTEKTGISVWEILLRLVAFGPKGVEFLGLQTADFEAGGALCEAAAFAKELEIWSMELQRHCPQDWNQCSSLLVRCLNGCQGEQQASQPEGDFVI